MDACERDPKAADAVNSLGTRNVAEAAEETGARVIYVSTNYVFDGTKAEEYAEEDRPAPLNAYGRSKLAGEAEVRGRGRHLVVRTSWVFGGGRNFVKTILEAAKRRGDVDVVDDQMGRLAPGPCGGAQTRSRGHDRGAARRRGRGAGQLGGPGEGDTQGGGSDGAGQERRHGQYCCGTELEPRLDRRTASSRWRRPGVRASGSVTGELRHRVRGKLS